MNKVGLVIVNYNRGSLVSSIVDAFSQYSVIDEIIVVDNCSTDDSRKILTKCEKGKVKCLILDKNLGYAKGNNVGLRWLRNEKQCDYCFIVNPDVFFEENVIKSVVDAFERNSNYAIITTARIDPMASIPQIQYSTRIFDTFWLQFLSYFNFVRHYYLLKRYGVYKYNKEDTFIKEIGVAPGSFFGIRMFAFPDGIVLDEGTFLYGEEDLLAKKCQLMNQKIGYLPYVVYEHRHIQYSTTLSKKSIAPIKYAMQSKRYFQKKYLRLGYLQKIMLIMGEKISIAERLVFMWFR